MANRQRIVGQLGDDMVEAALSAMLGDLWDGHGDTLGLKQPRSMWWSDMRRGLEAAFEKLLDEPTNG